MTTSGTERLIEGLVDDLEPVKPVVRLRRAVGIVLVAWAAVLGVELMSQPSSPGPHPLVVDRVHLASFVGLVFAALGATVSALAAGRPGREGLENGGLGICALSLSAASALLVAGLSGGAASMDAAEDAVCVQHGIGLALLPAVVILVFLVRDWATRPFRAALLGMVAAGALGAVSVHLSCDLVGPGHLLRGHFGVIVAAALVGTYPATLLLRRFRP